MVFPDEVNELASSSSYRRDSRGGSASPPLDDEHSSPREGSALAEIFRCYICLGKVDKAQMCPKCSKMCCLGCIQRWLEEQRPQCPHCRASLSPHEMVNCRFVGELCAEIERLEARRGRSALSWYTASGLRERECDVHGQTFVYYCATCARAICSDCAVFGVEHVGHSFERLSVTYERHVDSIRVEASGLCQRLQELSSLIASVDSNMERIQKAKEERVMELQVAMEAMQAQLDAQLKAKLLVLVAQKAAMAEEVELLDTMLHELNRQIQTCPPSALIPRCAELRQMLQDIHRRPTGDFARAPLSADFDTMVVPPHAKGEFVIRDFESKLRPAAVAAAAANDRSGGRNYGGGLPGQHDACHPDEVVYSPVLEAAGLAWRLKVYPNGNGVAQGAYLSVFLEMLRGRPEAAKYEYRVEMLHATNEGQLVAREFASEFEVGECWGYNRFYRIDLLSREGYLSDKGDALTLRFYVRASTFAQQCKDLQYALSGVQAERDEAVAQAAYLRKELARRTLASGDVTARSSAGSSSGVAAEGARKALRYEVVVAAGSRAAHRPLATSSRVLPRLRLMDDSSKARAQPLGEGELQGGGAGASSNELGSAAEGSRGVGGSALLLSMGAMPCASAAGSTTARGKRKQKGWWASGSDGGGDGSSAHDSSDTESRPRRSPRVCRRGSDDSDDRAEGEEGEGHEGRKWGEVEGREGGEGGKGDGRGTAGDAGGGGIADARGLVRKGARGEASVWLGTQVRCPPGGASEACDLCGAGAVCSCGQGCADAGAGTGTACGGDNDGAVRAGANASSVAAEAPLVAPSKVGACEGASRTQRVRRMYGRGDAGWGLAATNGRGSASAPSAVVRAPPRPHRTRSDGVSGWLGGAQQVVAVGDEALTGGGRRFSDTWPVSGASPDESRRWSASLLSWQGSAGAGASDQHRDGEGAGLGDGSSGELGVDTRDTRDTKDAGETRDGKGAAERPRGGLPSKHAWRELPHPPCAYTSITARTADEGEVGESGSSAVDAPRAPWRCLAFSCSDTSHAGEGATWPAAMGDLCDGRRGGGEHAAGTEARLSSSLENPAVDSTGAAAMGQSLRPAARGMRLAATCWSQVDARVARLWGQLSEDEEGAACLSGLGVDDRHLEHEHAGEHGGSSGLGDDSSHSEEDGDEEHSAGGSSRNDSSGWVSPLLGPGAEDEESRGVDELGAWSCVSVGGARLWLPTSAIMGHWQRERDLSDNGGGGGGRGGACGAVRAAAGPKRQGGTVMMVGRCTTMGTAR
eukprot:jgi/Mesvir1/2209/Mv09854-RA.1